MSEVNNIMSCELKNAHWKSWITRASFFALLTSFFSLFYLEIVDFNLTPQYFVLKFSDLVADAVIAFSEITNTTIAVKQSSYLLCLQSVEKCQNIILPLGAIYPYIVALFAVWFFIKKRFLYKFFVSLFTLFFVFGRAVIITWISLHFRGEAHYMFLLLLDSMVYIPMVLIVYTIANKSQLFQTYYFKFEKRFRDRFAVSSYVLILFILTLPAFPRLVLRYLDPEITLSFTHLHLAISGLFIELFSDYQTVIDGQHIFIERNWISLEGPCLGTGVMSIVLILIGTFKSPLLNRLSFSLLFVVSFVIMNAARLAFLLVYIHQSWGVKILDKVALHDQVTYVMYLFAIMAFIYYVMSFSDLKLTIQNKSDL